MDQSLPASAACPTVRFTSRFGYAETVSRLETAIAAAGLSVFARIDHAAGAAQAGLAMPPALVLIYGHAKGGTPLMLADPTTALDLPLRVLVHEDATGAVSVAYHPVGATFGRPGLPDALRTRLEPAQRLLHVALDA